MEDNDVLFVEVRNVELGFIDDDAIEGVTHGVLVLVHESETVAASEGVFNVFHVGVLVGQRGDGDEDGEWHTSAFALGEEETAWVSAVTVYVFVVVLSFTLDGIDYVLVHVADGGVIFDGGQDVSGVADDVVLSDGYGVGESVEFDHEFPLVVQVQNATFGIIFGADEDANHDVGLLVGNNVDLVGEGFVVQPVLAGLDDDVFLVFADSDGAADVDVEVVEVGDEFVDFDRVDLDSGEGELIVLVDGEVALVPEEDLGDGGQDAVVQGVAEDGFVVFQNSRGDLVTVVVIDDVSEELNGKGVQFSVVVVVDGVDGGLDHVSEDVDSVSVVDGNFLSLVGVDVSEIDGVDDSPFEVLDEPYFVGVVFVGFHVVGTDGEVFAVGVTETRVVSVFDFIVEVESVDVVKVVGETFEEVASQDLLVVVEEEFSASFGVVFVGLVHPEGVVQVEVVVVSVEGDVFGEVSETIFGVDVEVVVVVVLVFVIVVIIVFVIFVLFYVVLVVVIVVVGVEVGFVDGDDYFVVVVEDGSVHAVFVSFLNDFGVDEEMGVDLVGWGKAETAGVFAVEDGYGESVNELSGVDVDASPGGGFVEGIEVLGVIEYVEEGDNFFLVFLVEDGEDFTLWEHSIFVAEHEVLDSFNIGVFVQVFFDSVVLSIVKNFGMQYRVVYTPYKFKKCLLFL